MAVLSAAFARICVFPRPIGYGRGSNQSRNRLCEQISKVVKKVKCVEGDSLVIEFEDGCAISISLKSEDYAGPEAIIFQGKNHVWDVI